MLCCMWFIIVVITRNYSVTTRLTRRYVVTVSSTKFWFRILPAFGCVVAVKSHALRTVDMPCMLMSNARTVASRYPRLQAPMRDQ